MTEKTGPRFDPTINLGHIISLGGVITVFVGFIYLTDYRIGKVEIQLDKLSTVVIDNARMDQRINDHGRRLDDHGRRLDKIENR